MSQVIVQKLRKNKHSVILQYVVNISVLYLLVQLLELFKIQKHIILTVMSPSFTPFAPTTTFYHALTF